MKKSIKTIGLFAMILIVIVGFGFIVSSGSAQNDLKDKSQNAPEKSMDVPPGLEKHLVGPYLFTPYGPVKIAGVPEPPPKKLTNLKDGKGDLKVKGMQVSSDKVKQHISKKYGESGENIEISTDGDKKIKVINKKKDKMYILYLDENGEVRSSLFTSAPKEQKVKEVKPKPDLDIPIEQPRNGGDKNE